jgi:hypothetical protein
VAAVAVGEDRPVGAECDGHERRPAAAEQTRRSQRPVDAAHSASGEALRLVLVRDQQVAASVRSEAQGIAVAVHHHPAPRRPGQADKLRVEVRRETGGEAPAARQPARPQAGEPVTHQVREGPGIGGRARRAASVEQEAATAVPFPYGHEGSGLAVSMNGVQTRALRGKGGRELAARATPQEGDGLTRSAQHANRAGQVDALAARPAPGVGHAVGVLPLEPLRVEEQVDGRVRRDGQDQRAGPARTRDGHR